MSQLKFFFFNDPATTEIYTLSLHDALPILPVTAYNSPLAPRPNPVTCVGEASSNSVLATSESSRKIRPLLPVPTSTCSDASNPIAYAMSCVLDHTFLGDPSGLMR